MTRWVYDKRKANKRPKRSPRTNPNQRQIIMLTALIALALAATPVDSSRYEFAGLPAITYRSDAGLGMGVLASTARFEPHCHPYCWRFLGLLQGVLRSDSEGVSVPTRNAIVLWDLPQWRRPTWRLLLAVANYDDDNTGYYGVGTRATAGGLRGETTYQWHRRVAGFKLRQRWRGTAQSAYGYLDGYLGTDFGWNTVKGSVTSQLERDRTAAASAGDTNWRQLVGDHIGPFGDHAELVVSGGLIYDQRDHEFVPSRGGLHELSLRTGIAGDQSPWASLFFETSMFRSVVPRRLVVAARLIIDHSIGHLPVYRRAELGGLIPSLGASGAEGVRGVPTYAEAGKTKVVANLEARLRVWDHQVARQALSWRMVGFIDSGRAWTDLLDDRVYDLGLDAPWHSFLLGVGGGIRLLWGQAFVVRIDAARAPLDSTYGIYFGTDHIF
jgi:hypothetical protein